MKTLAAVIIVLLCLSMLSMFAPKAKAETAYLTDVIRLTSNSYDDRGAGWYPDSSKIVYTAFADSWYRHIWVMNADGSGKTQLTFGNVVDEGGDYSPDGSKIVFTRYGLRGWGLHDIFIMNQDGTSIIQITSTGLARLNVRWSNDGQRLAFYYGGAGTTTNEIHIMNIDGTNELTIASGTYPVMNPYWSPDDTKLVYTMDDGMWTVDTSPPYQKTRVFQTSLPTMYAAFSPDAKYVMYASGLYGLPNLQDLYLIDTNGNFVEQLTHDTNFGYIFDWSPDGQYIAFNSMSSSNWDVWRARIVITAQLTVTSAYDSPTPTSGTYTLGTSITASVTSPVAGSTGTQYVCTGWTGTGDVPASGIGITTTFIITQDSSITWNWKTEYYLTVKTDPPGAATIAGEGWYDASATPTLTAPLVSGKYSFRFWFVDGAYQGKANVITVPMSAPHTAIVYYGLTVGGEWTPIETTQVLTMYVLLGFVLIGTLTAGSWRRLKKR